MSPPRRVVITGLGVVTGLGVGADQLWDGLHAGRSAIGPVRQFDASAFPIQFAAEVEPSVSVRDYVPKSYRKALKVMCRDIELAVIGAAKAVTDAGIVTKASTGSIEGGQSVTVAPNRVGCQIGAGLVVAEINELTTAFAKARHADGSFDMAAWGNTGMNELTPLWLLKYLPNMLACHVTIIHDCQGPSNTITCCEASGALSIGESRRVIERGDADACFSGGAESKISPLGMLRQFHTKMMAQTQAVDVPAQEVIQPFGTGAFGSLPGEGSAILILEALESAQARRAGTIYAELAGFGAAQRADLSQTPPGPARDGAGVASAVKQALRDAHVGAEDIDAIVPTGAGIPAYDEAEFNGMRTVLGDRLARIPCVTSKPNIGLCAAAASAIDVSVAALCLKHQAIPARLNGEKVRGGINAGTSGPRDAGLNHVLITSIGFGGQHAAVILRRYTGVN